MGFAIGISGAMGVTGEVTLRILQERSFPVGQLRLFVSRRSAASLLSKSTVLRRHPVGGA
jgi:aspartate-semialdehyde dehydrogenase